MAGHIGVKQSLTLRYDTKLWWNENDGLKHTTLHFECIEKNATFFAFANLTQHIPIAVCDSNYICSREECINLHVNLLFFLK